MPGGNFDINVGKVRPGVYVNTKSKKQMKPKNSTRGIVVVPLIGYDWGPNEEFIRLSVESPDAAIEKLGRSIYDDNDSVLLIKEIFKNAITCYVYIINSGTAAKVTTESDLTITAVYSGARGNDIKVTSIANVGGGFDVNVYLDDSPVETYEGVKTVAELISISKKQYVLFSGSETDAPLEAFAAAVLIGGTNGVNENSMVTKFLDKIESIKWNTLCFPVEEKELQTACITKIKTLRSKVGKWVQAVIPKCNSDNEGIINVTNAVVIDNGTSAGKTLTVSQTCAWVTGITAAASKTESNTYRKYEGAIAISGEKTNEDAVLSIKKGEFFFSSSDEDSVIVDYDINSLHTFTTEKTSDYAKNRVMRVYDSFAADLALTFPPNKYDNSENGWLVMEGLGRALLQQYLDDGAIQHVELDQDFYVDKSKSQGDETFFNIGLQAVDSSEKLYFSVSTR